jgi:hypothetical protein
MNVCLHAENTHCSIYLVGRMELELERERESALHFWTMMTVSAFRPPNAGDYEIIMRAPHTRIHA